MPDDAHRIHDLLDSLWEREASDLFLAEGQPPAVRVHGDLEPLEEAPVSRECIEIFLSGVVPAPLLRIGIETGDLDVGVSLEGGRRIRLNLSRQHGGLALVARALPGGELSFEELGLPPELTQLADQPRGLVLVTGATGSGKSTTLAAMVHYLNSTRRGHIVTIEDPVEFVHENRLSRVSQREVGADTASFATALRHAVRQSPDVIVIGEVRDPETVSTAMMAALTGHLVLATLHTQDATQTLQRLIGLYPEEQRERVAGDLAICMRGVLSQRLLPVAEGRGRVLATEMLRVGSAAERLIREQRVDELQDLMRSSSDPGTFTFTHSLIDLFQAGRITYETGLEHATNPDEYALLAKGMATGVESGPTEAAALPQMDIRSLLRMAREYGASDLHISVGRPPSLRINGALRPLGSQALTSGDLRLLLYSILTGRQRGIYELEREIDFALSLDDGQRFRVNAYYHRGRMAAALRAIPTRIPEPVELGLPDPLLELGNRPQGLLLIVGPTGSGKTTTMACLINRINRRRACRIITIEDPIEYVFEPQMATIDQREVGEDTLGFAAALKHILRQDPDVIMVGEMRDLETIAAALTAAETGHLVIATLHTNDAVQAIDRIVDVFPAQQQGQVRAQLSSSLVGVVSQRLLPRAEGDGRLAVFEIMVANHAIRNLIRDKKMHQAAAVLETGSGDGMITLDQALAKAYLAGQIRKDAALRYVNNPQMLER